MLWITALEGLPVLMTHCHETSVQFKPVLLSVEISAVQFWRTTLLWDKEKGPERQAFYQRAHEI